jgi:sec-independent protein translocase protein TatC
MKESDEEGQSFWDHLESLRWAIMRVLLVLAFFMAIVFSLKDFVFDQIVFPPLSSGFVFFKWLCMLATWLKMPSLCPEPFQIELVNLNLAGQFMAHISTSFTISLLLAVPYLLYEIWKFIRPALYDNERKNIGWVFLSSSFLFYMGVFVSYFLIFPLTIRFLGTYQLSALVPNQISLDSYMSTLFILTLAMGIMFEMPVLIYFLSRLGIVNAEMLRNARNIAVVAILVISAIITPTTDPFTMLVVALPLYLLYELSAIIAAKTSGRNS